MKLGFHLTSPPDARDSVPSVADPLIDYATTSFAINQTTNHAQVPEPIGSLCMIVGLAPRVGRRGWTENGENHILGDVEVFCLYLEKSVIEFFTFGI